MATNTDSFTYSDGELNSVSGGAWINTRTGGQDAHVDTNQLKGNSAFDSPYRFNATYSGSALYTQMKAVTLASGAQFGLLLNISTDTDGNRDYYQLEFSESGGSYVVHIYAIVNGAAVGGTFLDEVTGVSLSNGDVIRFENDGSGNLRGLINGTPIAGLSANNTTLTHATVGIYTSDTTAARFDDWEGGDLVAGRTTKNTRSAPLGVNVGMNWRGTV